MHTVDEIRHAATEAGRAHARACGRPETPWTREDLAAANAELHRLARLHRIDLFGLPAGSPSSARRDS